MKILIRADGGQGIGLGHVMRMCVLAEALSENKENEVCFACRKSTNGKYDAGISIIKENKFKVFNIDKDNVVEDLIELQKSYGAHILITDSYEVDTEYFSVLNNYFQSMVYIDDVNKIKMPVDMIINQNINAINMNYRKNVLEETELVLGTQYCMLRREFRNAFKEKKIKEKVEDILLTLGGMDDSFNTLSILKNIKDCGKNIHVVVGKAFKRELIEEIDDIQQNNKNIFVYKNAKMAELMLICDAAIAGCGSTLYELSAMKVPSIGIIVADNQKETAEEMKKQGILYEVYDYSCENNYVSHIEKKLNILINNKNIRNEIVKKQSQCININGVYNIVEKIEALHKKVERNVCQ